VANYFCPVYRQNVNVNDPNLAGRYINLPATTNVKASRIIQNYPEYKLFTQNCQNFSQYLVRAICLNESLLCPETISDVLTRLFNPPARESNTQLPGTYPESLSSPKSNTYHTAFSYVETWSGEEWVTAKATMSMDKIPTILATKDRRSLVFEKTGFYPPIGTDAQFEFEYPRRLGIDGMRDWPVYVGIIKDPLMKDFNAVLQGFYFIPAFRKVFPLLMSELT